MFAPNSQFVKYLSNLTTGRHGLRGAFCYEERDDNTITVAGFSLSQAQANRLWNNLEFCLDHPEFFDVEITDREILDAVKDLYIHSDIMSIEDGKRVVERRPTDELKFKINKFLLKHCDDEMKIFILNKYLWLEEYQPILSVLISQILDSRRDPTFSLKINTSNVVRLISGRYGEQVIRQIMDIEPVWNDTYEGYLPWLCNDTTKGINVILTKMYLIDHLFVMTLDYFAKNRENKCFLLELTNQLRLGILFELNWIYENTDVPKDITNLIGEYIAPDLEMKKVVEQQQATPLPFYFVPDPQLATGDFAFTLM